MPGESLVIRNYILFSHRPYSLVGETSRLLQWLSGKESACKAGASGRCGFDPWVGKILWRKAQQPIPIFLPGESHGQRSLEVYSP